MARKNPFTSFITSIISKAAHAGDTFKSAFSSIKNLLKRTRSQLRKKPDIFSQELFESTRILDVSKVISQYQESKAWARSKKILPIRNANLPITENLLIRTKSFLQAEYQYIFKFQGAYKEGFERTSENVSLLTDRKLTAREALTLMGERLKDQTTTTNKGLITIESLQLEGVRTHAE